MPSVMQMEGVELGFEPWQFCPKHTMQHDFPSLVWKSFSVSKPNPFTAGCTHSLAPSWAKEKS